MSEARLALDHDSVLSAGRFWRAVQWLFVVAFLLFALLPFVWMFITSIKPEAEAYTTPITWWPSQPTLQNYVIVLTRRTFSGYCSTPSSWRELPR